MKKTTILIPLVLVIALVVGCSDKNTPKTDPDKSSITTEAPESFGTSPEPSETMPEPSGTMPEPFETSPEPSGTSPEPSERTPKQSGTTPKQSGTSPKPSKTTPAVQTSPSTKSTGEKGTTTQITLQRAKEIALSDAGLAESDVTWKKADRDYDDGRATYELKFICGETEFEFEIDAMSGKILDRETESVYD